MSRHVLLPLLLLLTAVYGQVAVKSGGQNKRSRPATRTGFELSGVAVNSVSNEPAAHVEISMGLAEQPNPLQTTVTGADGSFSFRGIAPAKYWLSAHGRGFAQQGLDEHEGYFTGIAVGANLDSQNITFRLRPDSSIVGLITDNDNEAVSGAEVMLFRTGLEGGETGTYQLQETTTNDEGRYHFGHLAAGSYYIVVSARPWYAQTPNRGMRTYVKTSAGGQTEETQIGPPDTSNPALDLTFPLTFYPGVTDPAGASVIDLQIGDQTTADVSLTAVPALHIHINGIGTPTGASLQQQFGSSVLQVPSQVAESENGIDIAGVPPGHYLLNMNAGNGAKSWSRPLDLNGDSEIDPSDSAPGIKVSGALRLNGQPAANAVVRLRNRASGLRFDAQTSDRGEFLLETTGFTPGQYEVAVFNVADAALGSISATGATVRGHSVQIGGTGAVHLNLTMSQGLARVEGVALRDGKPAAGTMVVLVPQKLEENASMVRRDQSDSDGTFALPNVLPGKYTVVALADGWRLEWLNPSVMQPFLKAGTPLEIGTGRKYAVKVRVQSSTP